MNENIEQNSKPETRSRKFWRVVLGSMVGFVLASIIVSILSVLMFLGMIASFEKMGSSTASTNVKDNSVLLLDLSASINERAVEIPFSFGDYMQEGLGLNNILAAINAAAGDPKIKGIYLKSKTVSASPASTKAIRDALMEFKKSGKFIYSYSDLYTQNAYYMATAADKILLNPSSDLSFRGYAFQLMFYKNLIDKMDIDVQIFRPEKRESNIQLVDSSKANTVLLNVDIFGSLDVGSYYILWDMVDLSEDIKKMMTNRDFARDEFFMQNIDREQFEQERLLQLFEDKKREYFNVFPEEALKMLGDEKKDE
jgi:hypothetical protein